MDNTLKDFISDEGKTPSPSDQRMTDTTPLYTILRPEVEDDGTKSDGNKYKAGTNQSQSLNKPNDSDDTDTPMPRRSRRKVKRNHIDYAVYDHEYDEDWFTVRQESSSRKKSRYTAENGKKADNYRTESRLGMNDRQKKEKQKPTLKMARIESMFPSKDVKENSKALLNLLKKPIDVKSHEDAKVRDSAIRMYISHLVKERMKDKDSTPKGEKEGTTYNSSPENQVAFFM
jgi:hypothetical protein